MSEEMKKAVARFQRAKVAEDRRVLADKAWKEAIRTGIIAGGSKDKKRR